MDFAGPVAKASVLDGEEVTQIVRTALATFAHELNQPLGAISNLASGSIRYVDEEGEVDFRHVLTQIHQEATRAREMAHHTAEFLVHGRLSQERLDLDALLREVVDRSAAARSPGVDLMLNGPPCTVWADSFWIRQVVSNLLANAREAAGEHWRSRLVVRRRGTSGRQVEVSVQNPVPGREAAALERCFAPGFTTKPGHLGYGLWISRSVVQAHGGDLRAESSTDEGMRFSFRLPRTHADLEEE